MLNTCYIHLANMLFTCYIHSICILYTFYIRFVYMLNTCCILVIYMLFTFYIHAIYILHALYTYYILKIHKFYKLFWTLFGHVLDKFGGQKTSFSKKFWGCLGYHLASSAVSRKGSKNHEHMFLYQNNKCV